MESQGSMPQMQFDAFLKPEIRARKGQRDHWNFRCGQLQSARPSKQALVVLPTGYGKTTSAMGDYLICREQGIVDRLLVFVPSDKQRKQWSEKAQQNARQLGHEIINSFQIDKKPSRALILHNENKCEVFVVSYQKAAADGSGWIKELMATGNWMVVLDEFHHLAEDQVWGKAAKKAIDSADCRISLLMSATPIRTDGQYTIGGGFEQAGEDSVELNPDVLITIIDGIEEQAIRRPVGRIQHYYVDVLPEGADAPIRLTTEQLRKEKVTNFDAYEARRRLRYVGKYLSTMLLEAVECLHAKNLEHPGQHQMLVFAMTCNHAKFIAAELNAMCGEGFADWVGVNDGFGFTRPEALNTAIMDRYDNNELPCLVQVDKAGEGFDHVRSSVLVFLNLISSLTKIPQQAGRGFRRNLAIERFEEDVCDIFASSDTAIADWIQTLTTEIALRKLIPPRPEPKGWPEIPELMKVDARFIRTDLVAQDSHNPNNDVWLRTLEKCGAPADVVEAIRKCRDLSFLAAFGRRYAGQEAPDTRITELPDETARVKIYLKDCEAATGTFAYRAARLLAHENGGGFEKSWIGDCKKLINARWKMVKGRGHDEMTSDDFIEKYEWIRQESNAMTNQGRLPQWLRLL